MNAEDRFSLAVRDYFYLLVRNYPTKSILKLVGDKYSLPAFQRTMLYRGVCTLHQTKIRSEKKISALPERAQLHIDGFNVIRSVGSYLNGNYVFYGMDGWLRDVSELHRKKLSSNILEKAVVLVIDFLHQIKIKEVHFYFDSPISHSEYMAKLVNRTLKEKDLVGNAETLPAPDHHLKEILNGYICTGDSNIIEESKVQVFDLASAVLNTNFQPQLFSMEMFTPLVKDL
ncbi:MAG: DUF434 domain-containing protein [Bacteroidales bacterium]|nr:DUF434 domain-containing protein [Bacteroidales bacterium]